ncbi:hypothetical protein FJY68_13350, partial [candidate division WOR-3 bacterium]|nr:hypothetical protein [candidate division WOR-3 bacterium]
MRAVRHLRGFVSRDHWARHPVQEGVAECAERVRLSVRPQSRRAAATGDVPRVRIPQGGGGVALAEAPELLVNDLDTEFKNRLAEKYGDTGFMHCLSCGSCSASCPVRKLEEKYNPRRIIRMAIMGMKDEVYKSEFVWMCSYHTTCLHRCPQGVNIGEVADVVSRMAEEVAKAGARGSQPNVKPADL